MFDPAAVVAREFGEYLAYRYWSVYGDQEPDFGTTLRAIAQLLLERIASSDALYHDANHTLLVTLVGQSILAGKILVEPVRASDWAHFTISTLAHDIGYLRGICPGDRDGNYVIDDAGNTVQAPRGATDGFLAPWHVERGKIFVRHRCAAIPNIDVERIARAIELTRFPVPLDNDYEETDTEAGLVRAADLIGQLGDPLAPRKRKALFMELVETGIADELGYTSAADLADHYPKFFWSKVEPYIGTALDHLDRTIDGKRWVAQLYAHVFVEEHLRKRSGPERGHNRQAAAS
jgi:hypothetical protein